MEKRTLGSEADVGNDGLFRSHLNMTKACRSKWMKAKDSGKKAYQRATKEDKGQEGLPVEMITPVPKCRRTLSRICGLSR